MCISTFPYAEELSIQHSWSEEHIREQLGVHHLAQDVDYKGC